MTVEHGNRKALDNEILRTVVGSEVHGLAIEGTDDNDEMGVFIEPVEDVLGLRSAGEHYTYRTAAHEGARSYHGDTDLVLYGLRKYLRLAAKGNPTVMLPLWAPKELVLKETEIGYWLRTIRQSFLSRQSVNRYLGYMHSQHERMKGQGKQNRVPNRPELIARYGYDTKFASHALRLAMEGHEIVQHQRLTLPMAEGDRQLVLEVKTGKYKMEEVSFMIDYYTASIKRLLPDSPLPEEPDWDRITEFSINAHRQHWGY